MRRFPFYYTFKCAFIVWLMLPSTRVSECYLSFAPMHFGCVAIQAVMIKKKPH